MNDYDRENLQFLLNVDTETLMDWYDSVDEDDHLYASELMDRYSEELKIKARFYEIEKVDLTNLTSDADEYMKKFRLGKPK